MEDMAPFAITDNGAPTIHGVPLDTQTTDATNRMKYLILYDRIFDRLCAVDKWLSAESTNNKLCAAYEKLVAMQSLPTQDRICRVFWQSSVTQQLAETD